MKLGELFNRVKNKYPEFVSMYRYIDTNVFKDLEIVGITDDSRKIKPGYLFVAIKGLEHDGHKYIEQAIEKGAVAVVFDVNFKSPASIRPASRSGQISNFKFGDVATVATENTRRALGLLWAAWYDFPSSKLKVIGITGTDGKTTTANLLYHILKESGKKVGLISTINARIGDREIDTGFHVTNPEPELLQKLLSEMAGEGLEYVCLEVTSHGIDQERIAGVKFLGAVITNVTREHLDYHKTYQNYLETKGKLFKDVSFSILNADDDSFNYLKSVSSGQLVTYGINNDAFVLANRIISDPAGSRFLMVLKPEGYVHDTTLLYSNVVNGGSEIEVGLQIPGVYNVSNALAASAAALELGLTLQEIKNGLESFSGLEGRFEEMNLGQPFRVIVDFAHTPNALEQVLGQITKHKSQNTKVICVFGCAGERDKEKRQMMGEISGRLANASVLTAEDPRRENLDDIINRIADGCLKSGAHEIQKSNIKNQNFGTGSYFIRIPDRHEAIETALSLAQNGDIVIITGKGHEKSMCFGTTEYPWSDRSVAKEFLSKLQLERSK